MSKILILLGKTCSGKTTSGSILEEKYGFKKCVTYTTRPPRPGEVEGVDYHFVDDETFFKMRDNDEFAEYAFYDVADGSRWYYGSTKKSYKEPGKHYIILNPIGFKMVKKANVDAISVLLDLSEDEIRRRIESRGDKSNEAERRIKADRIDFDGLEGYDQSVNCDGLTEEQVADLINEIFTVKWYGSKEYFTEVFRTFNSFGNMKEKAEALLQENRDLNIAFFALTAIFLAFQYRKEDHKPWDERDLKSKEYAYNNRNVFLDIFQKYSGLTLYFNIDQAFTQWCNFHPFANTIYEAWARAIVSEHPTIRQSYMRGFVGALHEELGIPDEGFPMI